MFGGVGGAAAGALLGGLAEAGEELLLVVVRHVRFGQLNC